MRNFKFKSLLNAKIRFIALVAIMFTFSSCGNAKTNTNIDNNNSNVKTEASSEKFVTNANPSDDIDKAKKDGKAVFLVITGTGATGADKLVTVAKEANAKLPKSVLIQMNKDDASNSALVTKLGIANVPVPFIIVISPKGVPVQGLNADQATADALIKAIPSPKQDEVLFAITEKKPVFIIVSKKGLTDKTAILTNCKSASSKIASKPIIVEIDFADTKEADFLKQMGVTAVGTKTIVVIANASGQITGRYEGSATETELTASANKVIKSGGCCPGGSTNGCGKK